MSSKNTAMHNLNNSKIRGKLFFDTCHENTQKTNGTYMFRTKTTVNMWALSEILVCGFELVFTCCLCRV